MLPKFLADLDPNVYFSSNYVVLDFETDTSHGDYGHPVHPDNQLILACWRHGPGHQAYDGRTRALWGGEFDMGELIADIQKADFIVAHNAKYELGWLKRAGLDLRTVLPYDTKLGELVLLGNLAAGDDTMVARDTDLDTVCRRRGLPVKDPVVDILIHHGVNPVGIPRRWLEGRCRQDVETTEAVFLQQRAQLAASNRLAVLYTRCLLTPLLADIEFEGMALDAQRVEEEHAKQLAELVALSAEMDLLTGGINWRSPVQSAEFIYDKLGFKELVDFRGNPKRNPPSRNFPEGSRKTDKKTLDKLVATTEEQKRFVALRKKLGKANAALSKNLDFFLGVVREQGCTFVGEFHQTKTATHRLSSTGVPLSFEMFDGASKSVQFQNMPRAFKRLLRAKRPGWLIFDPDGSMLEFRVAVFLGADSQGLRDVEDVAWDAHVTSGAAMAQKPYAELYAAYKAGEKWAEEIRQNAKTETFKPLYGGEKGTEDQERWYAEFRKRYPELAKVQAGWVREVLETKRLITPWGLRFYWPYAKMSRSGRVNVKSAVYNYPVQSLATAEIIPIAMVYFWHRLRDEGLEEQVFIVNTVHDSLPMEVHPDAIDAAKVLAKQCFTRDVYNYLEKVYKLKFTVPLGVGLKAGEHWGEGKEESYDIYPDGREVRRK